MSRRLWIFFSVAVLITLLYFFVARENLSLDSVQRHLTVIRSFQEKHAFASVLIFGGSYVMLTGLSIPGSIVLTLLAGATFGTLPGSLLVTACGTLGAVISFLLGRYFLRDFVVMRFHRQFHRINRSVQHDGSWALLALRMLPASPFVVINLVLGVTTMKIWTYAWVTALGMLPGNLLYVHAGTKISQIESVSHILDPGMIFALIALGLFPVLVRWLLKRWRRLRPGRIFN